MFFSNKISLAGLICALLLAVAANAQFADMEKDLQALTAERELLTKELEQYQRTIELLHRGSARPEQSKDPAIKRLALEIIELKKRVIVVTEREVALLQELIAATKLEAEAPTDPNQATQDTPARAAGRAYSLAEEEAAVKRLQALLAGYYAELAEAELTQPSLVELEQRAAAQLDALKAATIEFSPDKVHLNGAEGSTVLTRITQRLADTEIPESRRDIAPICAIKTRLFGSLIASESRSLRPVGKNHFVARVRIQPGNTIVRIRKNWWEIQLPKDVNTREFLITLYTPPGSKPELHIFAIDELLAEENPHLPAWLPDELKISSWTQ